MASKVCKRVCLQNLPIGINEEELISDFVKVFGGVLGESARDGSLKVEIYEPHPKPNIKGYKVAGNSEVMIQKACVEGFSVNFEDLKQLKTGKKIGGRDINIKPDRGDARDKWGNFLTAIKSEDKRGRNRLAGKSDRKVTLVFTKKFLDEVNPAVFNGSSATIYFNADKMKKGVLDKVGRVERCHRSKKPNSMLIEYSTEVEALQAIVYLNGNPELCCPPSRFCNFDVNIFANCFTRIGIGKQGEVLNVAETMADSGFIPFSKLDDTILNREQIHGMKSVCWKCKREYEMLGLDASLSFAVGRCKGNCEYNSNLDVTDQKRAFFWIGESFTRLVHGPADFHGKHNSWIINFPPLQSQYDSPSHYREVVLPVVQEEYKYRAQSLAKHTCSGEIITVEFVEQLEDIKGHDVDVYAIQLKIAKDKFWNRESFITIKKVTLNLSIRTLRRDTEVTITEKRKGVVVKMTEIPEAPTSVYLFVRIHLDVKSLPVTNENVLITPKPNKDEYNSTKRILMLWIKNETEFPLLQILLNANQDWKMPKATIERKPLGPILYPLTKITRQLNEEQVTALKTAEASTLSVIQGPPGTGKTYLASALITYFSWKEYGAILACAPSNFATDGLALAILSTSSKFKLKLKILRIYSKIREAEMIRRKFTTISDESYGTLHEQIRLSPNWLKTEELVTINQKMREGNEHLLTLEERNAWKLHVRNIEKEVMSKYDVFVCTLGALADKRVESWGKDHQITTVVVDEAAQLTHPATAAMFLFKQHRSVLLGDQEQLKAIMESFAADFAGLPRSLMEFIDKSQNCVPVPWTLLKEQQRMAPTISSIVSCVTYNGELRDGPLILTRTMDLPDSIYNAIPQLKQCCVVVYDHRDEETKMEPSYMNEGEVERTVKIVEKLLKADVLPCKITILTLYDAQKEALKSRLLSIFGQSAQEVIIANVDAYQGRENSIVILNFVRSNQWQKIGFSAIRNRVNVAISRAKFFLIIFCNLQNFRKHKNQAWTTLLSELNKKACIVQDY